MDLQNIATHEFGHNGLADLIPPKDAELTMYYASTFGEVKKRTKGEARIQLIWMNTILDQFPQVEELLSLTRSFHRLNRPLSVRRFSVW
jgi:hypothetical protein